MAVLHLDCIYLPTTEEGFNMVILAVCCVCKWIESMAMHSNNSKEAA